MLIKVSAKNDASSLIWSDLRTVRSRVCRLTRHPVPIGGADRPAALSVNISQLGCLEVKNTLSYRAGRRKSRKISS
jgi:hypothetical protein